MPVFNPKKGFILSGSNMNFTKNVTVGDRVVEDLIYLGTTGVSGLIPADAITEELSIETTDGILSLGKMDIVLDSLSQVVASGLTSGYVSGKAGDIIQLSGDNFHQITDINFGSGEGRSGEFNVISENIIETIVPSGATYDEITVFSSLRTGLNGDESFASGKTYNKFIPIPTVTGLNSGQIIAGGELIIEGIGLSGVTGVQVNDIAFTSFTSLDGTGVKATVPTGNVRGVPELLLQSGAKVSAGNNLLFKPYGEIVGITPGVNIGEVATISGTNLSSGILYTGEGGGTGCLISIGSQTGNFKLINDAGGYNRLQGHIPTGLGINLSGGNIAVGPTILTSPINLFSNGYPESYSSSVSFRPGIPAPEVTGVSPISGVGQQSVTIEGDNLYGITGVNFRGGNVGVGTEFSAQNIIVNEPGKSITTVVPNTSNFNTNGGFLDIDISGYYGTGSITNGFFVYGTPNVSKIIPDTDVEPGSTGTIYGSRLYSGSIIRIYNNNVAPANFRGDVEVSGYSVNHDEIIFNYPNNFQTGNNYRIRVTNQRGSSSLEPITAFYGPTLSGVSLVSGEYGDPVVISGYFSGIKPSGLKIGDKVVPSFTQVSTTGISFNVPKRTSSDIITVDTSGGFVSSTGIINISPSKPTISGYFIGQGEAPTNFDSGQVFKESDIVTVTGDFMSLVTGVVFSGAQSTFVIDNFVSQEASNLKFNVPKGVNTGSGQFILKDFKSRETESPYPINVTHTSGTNSYLLPGETLNISGDKISGLTVDFVSITGGFFSGLGAESSTTGQMELLSTNVPTGVAVGNLRISGRGNGDAGSVFSFLPLGIVSGVTGFDSNNKIETGSIIAVSGINAGSDFMSGDLSIGISGTGNQNSLNGVHLYQVDEVVTGSGIGSDPNAIYTKYNFKPDNSFIGTGQLFIVNSWDDLPNSGFYGSDSETYLQKQINVFPDQYIITGTRVNATGYAPSRGVTGSSIEISGEGFNAVSGVFFEIPSGANLESDFTINSDNKITAMIPTEAIEARGMTNILLSGGTNQNIGEFEVILDASVVEFNIVEENDVPVSSTRVGNFTQKETSGGVVYLVTRTRFPDGTTAIVSSVPEA
tara:strand:+ start:13618 stop:16905 length:3288 start_codon:yes stop_codon:yes gene_type:complete